MPRFALQTFTVRKYLKSPAAIDSGFARIRETGLQAVEMAYIKLRPAHMDAVERACRAHGITVGSSQIRFDILDRQRDQMLRLHEQLHCRISAVSVLPFRVIRGERDDMLRFAERLEALGSFYREHGVQLCFHHHDFDFRHYGEDVGLDLLLANTSPENIGLELDTYWVARGGRSPRDMIDSLAGRVKVVHLRDFRLEKTLLGVAATDAALGRGNLDFAGIVDSCIANNVHYMAIEQASDQPFADVATSVAHLRQLGYDALF